MLGGQVLTPALLLGQVFLEMGGGEGEGLPTEAHQVGVLEPGVTEAVLDGRAGPEEEVTSQAQVLRGFQTQGLAVSQFRVFVLGSSSLRSLTSSHCEAGSSSLNMEADWNCHLKV